VKQRDDLIFCITEMITLDDKISAEHLADTTHALSPPFYSWVAKYREDMRTYVHRRIMGTVSEDMIDPYGCKLVDEALTRRRKTAEAKAEAEFDGPTVRAQRLTALTTDLEQDLAHNKARIVAEGEVTLAAERAAITAVATVEINKYREEACIKTAEEKARLDEVAVTAVCRSSHLAAIKSTPLASNNKKKPKLGKRKANTLDLQTPSPVPLTDSDSEYAPSEVSKTSTTADKLPIAAITTNTSDGDHGSILTTPSSVPINNRMHTPGWVSTHEPAAIVTHPASTIPKSTPQPPTVPTEPALAAILAAITAVGGKVDAITNWVTALEMKPSRLYLDQIPSTEGGYAIKASYDAWDVPNAPDDAEMYDPARDKCDMVQMAKVCEAAVNKETYFDDLYKTLRD
jgi:hypothetical protein